MNTVLHRPDADPITRFSVLLSLGFGPYLELSSDRANISFKHGSQIQQQRQKPDLSYLNYHTPHHSNRSRSSLGKPIKFAAVEPPCAPSRSPLFRRRRTDFTISLAESTPTTSHSHHCSLSTPNGSPRHQPLPRVLVHPPPSRPRRNADL